MGDELPIFRGHNGVIGRDDCIHRPILLHRVHIFLENTGADKRANRVMADDDVGCLETVASSRAIVKAARERGVRMPDGGAPSLEGVIRAARADELSAIELLQEVGEKVGEGVASLLHLADPDMVVLGGEIVKAGDLITVPVRQAMNKYALARIRGHCDLRLSALGGDAAILGTQMMAMEHLRERTGMAFALYE